MEKISLPSRSPGNRAAPLRECTDWRHDFITFHQTHADSFARDDADKTVHKHLKKVYCESLMPESTELIQAVKCGGFIAFGERRVVEYSVG